MVRVLLIQQLFNLSDEQMEFQSLDRLSFQRFAGLRASSQITNRTTIWPFKERLIRAGTSESIFDAVNRRIAKPRSRVEHVFAGLAQLGGKVLRSIGLARAALHLNWKAATYNLRRLSYLKEAGGEALLTPEIRLNRQNRVPMMKRPSKWPVESRQQLNGAFFSHAPC